MARRALMLREGRAPVWDRLLTMLFLAGLLHGLIIVGITFNAAARSRDDAPGLEILLVSDELPEADKNETATYLAQRTQKGSGNTKKHVAPRNRTSSIPTIKHEGTPEGDSLADAGDRAGASQDERVLTSVAWSTSVRYLADNGDSGTVRDKPLLIDQAPTAEPGPDEEGPAQLRGEKHDELWITPDTRAAALAPYLDSWRRKVERIGTLNFPTVARISADSRSPVIEVALSSDGKYQASIHASSGNPELDQAALSTLKLASPFDPFPPELAAQFRVLHFRYAWQFTGGRGASGAVSVP
jgi:protein TonB